MAKHKVNFKRFISWVKHHLPYWLRIALGIKLRHQQKPRAPKITKLKQGESNG